MPLQRPPEGTRQIPRRAQAAPPLTTNRPDERGRNLGGPTEVCPEAPGMGREEKHVDIGGHMGNCRQDSFCTPRSREGAGHHSKVGTRRCGEFKGRQETTGGGFRQGSGDATWVGSPSPPGSLAPVKGVVLVCGRPCSPARSVNPQVDHGEAGGPLHLRSTPGGKYPNFC